MRGGDDEKSANNSKIESKTNTDVQWPTGAELTLPGKLMKNARKRKLLPSTKDPLVGDSSSHPFYPAQNTVDFITSHIQYIFYYNVLMWAWETAVRTLGRIQIGDFPGSNPPKCLYTFLYINLRYLFISVQSHP